MMERKKGGWFVWAKIGMGDGEEKNRVVGSVRLMLEEKRLVQVAAERGMKGGLCPATEEGENQK
jgi:hypothetical protein